MPNVVTVTPYVTDTTLDDVTFPNVLRQLEELGADVVGLNCGHGPSTTMPLLRECRKVCKVCCGYVLVVTVMMVVTRMIIMMIMVLFTEM